MSEQTSNESKDLITKKAEEMAKKYWRPFTNLRRFFIGVSDPHCRVLQIPFEGGQWVDAGEVSKILDSVIAELIELKYRELTADDIKPEGE